MNARAPVKSLLEYFDENGGDHLAWNEVRAQMRPLILENLTGQLAQLDRRTFIQRYSDLYRGYYYGEPRMPVKKEHT